MGIKVNLSNIHLPHDLKDYGEKVASIDEMIVKKSGPGSDFLGWVDYAKHYDKEEFEAIKKWAKYVRENYEVLVVAGIGGSYLGARAVIEAINGLYGKNGPEIIFMGQTLNQRYLQQVLEYLEGKTFAINVISKTGTTTETSISFRLLKDLLEKKVGKEEARKAIFATTDKAKGALLTLSKQEGYVRFVIPDDVGGRYSVITAVGLFPIAVAGIDIDLFMEGTKEAMEKYDDANIETNECYQYALMRHLEYLSGKANELFITYDPSLVQLGEWFKQLYGESEGKDGKSLFPTSATFTTDLHSLGQFIQEGSKVFFETVLWIKDQGKDLVMPSDKDNLDGLNYLSGKSIAFVNEKAYQGVLEAHTKNGHNDNVIIEMDKLDAKELGSLIYFFEKACAMSAYLNEVNPFNQPGVEIYKKNMFHLLGKPGY